jgi:RimJ/RimL family protein N-acetyltransferase
MKILKLPSHVELAGKAVTLSPFDNERHTEDLFAISEGKNESVWDYLYYGPFSNAVEMKAWYLANLVEKPDILSWVIFSNETRKPIGFIALMSIVAPHGRAEIGHVWLTPSVHKTKANTEAQYLLLSHVFDNTNYRRVEWRCNSLNHASRTAASRMGFTFEGRFRKHMFLKGASRDTDWFSMIDTEWLHAKKNFETWLNSETRMSLMELNNA